MKIAFCCICKSCDTDAARKRDGFEFNGRLTYRMLCGGFEFNCCVIYRRPLEIFEDHCGVLSCRPRRSLIRGKPGVESQL